MPEIVGVTLAVAYLYARWALHRSEQWQAEGLCAGCGAEAPRIDVGGNQFCEVCAPAALKNSQVGAQFFAFAGITLAIALVALLLSGDDEQTGEVIALRTKVGVASGLFIGVAWWIHRRMKRKEVR